MSNTYLFSIASVQSKSSPEITTELNIQDEKKIALLNQSISKGDVVKSQHLSDATGLVLFLEAKRIVCSALLFLS